MTDIESRLNKYLLKEKIHFATNLPHRKKQGDSKEIYLQYLEKAILNTMEKYKTKCKIRINPYCHLYEFVFIVCLQLMVIFHQV